MFTSSLGAEAVARAEGCRDLAQLYRPARKRKGSLAGPPASAQSAPLAPIRLPARDALPSAFEIRPPEHPVACSLARLAAIADASARFPSPADLSPSDKPRSTKRSTFVGIRLRPQSWRP